MCHDCATIFTVHFLLNHKNLPARKRTELLRTLQSYCFEGAIYNQFQKFPTLEYSFFKYFREGWQLYRFDIFYIYQAYRFSWELLNI